MKTRGLRGTGWGLALGVLLTAGACDVRRYEIATRIDADGTFHRTIFQPLDLTLPPEAIEGESEADAEPTATQPTTQPARVTIAPKWRGLWSSFKTVTAPADVTEIPYIQAAGDFETIDDVPASYHRAVFGIPDRASEDLPAHSLDEYFLFGIDHWQEDITETVMLSEYIGGCDELLGLAMPPLHRAIDARYGRTYELKKLHEWLRRQATPALRRAMLWYYQYKPQNADDISGAALQELTDIFALLDIELPATDGDYLDTEAAPEAIESGLIDVLQSTVRHKSGVALSDEEAEALWEQIQTDLGIDLSSEGDDDSPGDTHTRPTHRRISTGSARPAVKVAAPKVSRIELSPARRARLVAHAAQRRHMSASLPKRPGLLDGVFLRRIAEETVPPAPPLIAEFERQFEDLMGSEGMSQLTRLEGQLGGAHHNSPLLRLASLFEAAPLPSPGFSTFEFKLETPGPMIETNGVRLGDRTVRWQFNSQDLFPDGYSMYARSIRWRREAEKRLFGKTVLNDYATVVHLLDVIEYDGPVYAALEQAVKEGSLKPIEELATDSDESVRKGAEAILALKSPSRRGRK